MTELSKLIEILENYKNSEFIKIGTYREDSELRLIQDMVFLSKEPEEIKIAEKRRNDRVFIHLMQIHSLKGVRPVRQDKVGKFLFFLEQFWNNNSIKEFGALSFEGVESRIIQKLDEFVDLSLKKRTVYSYFRQPNVIIFPENSIPYEYLDKLKGFSRDYELLIIGGLEHKKLNSSSSFINQAFIIDQGYIKFQIKQTPVQIYDKTNNSFLTEPIKCEKIPKIAVFNTSIGRISIFICKDFLRMYECIPEWVKKFEVDYIFVPSLTTKILPFFTKMQNLFDNIESKDLVAVFNNAGEYGGSEVFSVKRNPVIEENFRTNRRDNVGEVIVIRDILRLTLDGEKKEFLLNGGVTEVYDIDEFIEYVMKKNPKIETLEGIPLLTTATGAEITQKIKKYFKDNNIEFIDLD